MSCFLWRNLKLASRSLELIVAAVGTAAGIAFLSGRSTRSHDWTDTPFLVDSGRTSIVIREKKRPVGCRSWPAGHVLLEYALTHLPPNAVVLEIGSGCGLTAIGLAKARPCTRVIATDYCEKTLLNLRHNVRVAAVGSTITVAHWDLAQANQPLPFDISQVTHVLAADMIYIESVNAGLAEALDNVLVARPCADAYVLIKDRFTGDSTAPSLGFFDAGMATFEASAACCGLAVSLVQIPDSVNQAVHSGQDWKVQMEWWLRGHVQSMRLYKVSRRSETQVSQESKYS